MRKRESRRSLIKPTITLVAAILFTYLMFFVPPISLLIICIYIVMATILSHLLLGFFLSGKESAIAALFVGLLLITNYMAGFNLINTILLVSFIIGIRLLVK